MKGSVVLTIKPHVRLLVLSEDGQTLGEYAIIMGVITLAVVGVFTALGGGVAGALNGVISAF
jgi:Flp pilus assembly pilin Flp